MGQCRGSREIPVLASVRLHKSASWSGDGRFALACGATRDDSWPGCDVEFEPVFETRPEREQRRGCENCPPLSLPPLALSRPLVSPVHGPGRAISEHHPGPLFSLLPSSSLLLFLVTLAMMRRSCGRGGGGQFMQVQAQVQAQISNATATKRVDEPPWRDGSSTSFRLSHSTVGSWPSSSSSPR